MPVFLFFIKLHVLRWYRYVNELGPIRSILLLLVAAFAVKNGIDKFFNGLPEIGFVLLLFGFAIQMQRKDQQFFKVVNLSPVLFYTPLFALICVPSIIGFIILDKWIYLSLIVTCAALLPFVKKSTFSLDRLFVNMGAFLPYKYFEWRCGLRQYGLAVSATALIGMSLSKFPGAVPIAIFFLTLNTSIFYLFGESKELLVASGKSEKQLLFAKIKGHLKLFYLLILPMVLLDVMLHYEYWYVLLYALLVAFLANINAILFKYASYQPGARFDNNSLLQGLMLAFFLVPFLFPIPIIMMVVNYKKARLNLEPYFK